MSTFMVASHAEGKGAKPDPVFAIVKEANDAIKKFGKDQVVNATIGAIYDEKEQFATFPSVEKHLKQMPAEEIMNYAPIAGLPEFLQAAIEMTFNGNMPENTFAKAVATPGGTGAIRQVFNNYLEPGQKALVPDWGWGNYQNIADEHMRKIDKYMLFDEDNNFNMASVREKVTETLKEQDNLVIIFNTPAHNPTGHMMTEADWVQVIDFMKECAQDQEKRITLLLDIAYIDFAGEPEETRKFFRLFHDLPKNMLIAIAYSMSKSFFIYGMRSGALIGLSSSQEVVDEFFQVNTGSNRGVWSNGTRSAQRLLADVWQNPELKASIDKERAECRELMTKRADIFMTEAKEVGLKTFPYHSGFFITVPAPNPAEALKKLAQENIFAVDFYKGIRIAICGIPAHKIPGVAGKIKKAL